MIYINILALQHSTYAAIYDLIAQSSDVLEAAVYYYLFLTSFSVRYKGKT